MPAVVDSATGVNATPAMDTTGATFLVCCDVMQSTGVPVVTDNFSNTWTRLSYHDSTGIPQSGIHYCASPTVGAGHIATISGGSWRGAGLIAFSGFTFGSVTQDVFSAATSITSKPGIVTPTTDGSIIIAMVAHLSGATVTADSGFTVYGSLPNAGSWPGAWAYLIQSTAAAVDVEFTMSGSSDVVSQAAVFEGVIASEEYIDESLRVIFGDTIDQIFPPGV